MSITKPKQTPSPSQLEKAKRCVVYQHSPTKFQVWDPKVDSFHWVENGVCDCSGFLYHQFCSHVCAVAIKAKRSTGMTAQQAIDELYDF